MPNQTNSEDITTVQTMADKIVADNSGLHSLYNEIEQAYFMDDAIAEKPTASAHDPDDIKVTLSPSARNDIIGIVRVMTATEAQIKAKSDTDTNHADDIEKLCRRVISESGLLSRGRITTDAVRATALYADTHLMLSSLDAMIQIATTEEKAGLQEIRKRTPFQLEVVNPNNGYPAFGRHGMRKYLRREKVRGEAIKEEWTLPAGMTLDDATDYEFNEWWDKTNRGVWLTEFKAMPLLALTPHNLPELPISVALADGSALWPLPERMRQPFLYAKIRGGWLKRENLFYTQLFTSLWERGTGVLVGFDDDPGDVTVDFAGPGVRYIKAAKSRLLSDSALDPNLLVIKNQILDPIDAESTVYKQVLGSNAGASSTPFSSLSLLSSSGQVALTAIRESVQNSLKQILLVMLRWIKREGVDLKGIVDMKASDIPDDIELEITLDVKLPQDTFRNAQIAETLEKNGDVSHEWVQSNLLQIPDSKEMRKQIWTEQTAEVFYQALVQKALADNQNQQQQGTPASTGPSGGTGTAGGVVVPAGPGAEAAMAGGATLPATEPVTPPGTNLPTPQGGD